MGLERNFLGLERRMYLVVLICVFQSHWNISGNVLAGRFPWFLVSRNTIAHRHVVNTYEYVLFPGSLDPNFEPTWDGLLAVMWD